MYKANNSKRTRRALHLCSYALLLNLLSMAVANAESLTLTAAQQQAIAQDPWLKGSHLKEQALKASGVAAASLPDPMISVGLANLPTDSFDFAQEAMTQLKVGVSQQFSRGDSLAIARQQFDQMADQQPQLRAQRQAQLKLLVARQWLAAFASQQKLQLIRQNRPLFEQLAAIVAASYSSAQGNTRQQDVLRAQVELARLDDRLTTLQAEHDGQVASLQQWLHQHDQASPDAKEFGSNWPDFAPMPAALEQALVHKDHASLAAILAPHPALLAIEQQVKSAESAVQLVEQKYQPQWSVNASYAYRDDDPMGRSRADFFSVGLSVDLPLFTAKRQDQQLESARLQAEASKTDKQLMVRQLVAELLSHWQQLQGSNQRIANFSQSILPSLAEQAEAALTAYTHDDGDFAEVMRARIARLNAELEFVDLRYLQARHLAELQYYFCHLPAQSAQSYAGASL